MHYKDGTRAKVGDIVRGPTCMTKYDVTGVVSCLMPSSDSCNATIYFATRSSRQNFAGGEGGLAFPMLSPATVSCKDMELVDRAPE